MSETNTCGNCKLDIAEKQCAVVDGIKYHVACFVCKACSAQLGGKKFHKKEGAVYCEACNIEKFAPTCAGCQKKIAGKHLVVEDKKFHSECFVCQFCTVAFGKDGYFKEEDLYVCKKCLALRQDRKCAGCKELIEDDEIFALDQYYHGSCFKCAKCEKPLGEESFVNIDGQPFHATCVKSQCVVCGSQCEGEFYEVEDGNICHIGCISKYDAKIHTQPPQAPQFAASPGEKEKQKQLNEPKQIQQVQQQQVVEEVKNEPQAPVNSKYLLKTMDTQDVNSIDPSCLDPDRPRYTLAELRQNPPPAGVPLGRKEIYLSDEEFNKVFKMKLNRFLALKEWKRAMLKKQMGIF